MRGMTGKSKAMWHSGSSSVPKNAATSRGHWFASAMRMRPGYSSSTIARSSLDELVRRGLALAVALLGLEEVGDGVEPEPVDAEVEPETGRRRRSASCTAGFSKLRSGWCEKKRWKKNWRRTGSNVQFDSSVSTKMMRMFAYFSSVSLQT